jgi:ankyrin repeat protein
MDSNSNTDAAFYSYADYADYYPPSEWLWRAVENGDIAFVDYLLNDPAYDPTRHDNICVTEACRRGYLDIVNRLLTDPRVDPSADRINNSFWCACVNGHLDVVNRLLEIPRLGPSIDHNICLRHACDYGKRDIVERLILDPRVDPSVIGRLSLTEACRRGNIDTVKKFLASPLVDPSANDNRAICAAASGGHLYIVELLLDDSRVDSSEAMICAARNGHLEVFNYIVAHAVMMRKYNFCFNHSPLLDRVEGEEFLPIIEKYEEFLIDQCNVIKEELMINRWHPSRVERLLLAGYDIEDM